MKKGTRFDALKQPNLANIDYFMRNFPIFFLAIHSIYTDLNDYCLNINSAQTEVGATDAANLIRAPNLLNF